MAEPKETTPTQVDASDPGGSSAPDGLEQALRDAREELAGQPRDPAGARARAGQLRAGPRHHRRTGSDDCAVPTSRSSSCSTATSSGCPGSPATSRRSSGSYVRDHPVGANRATLSGRVALDRRPSRSTTCSATRTTDARTSSGWPASAPCCRAPMLLERRRGRRPPRCGAPRSPLRRERDMRPARRLRGAGRRSRCDRST